MIKASLEAIYSKPRKIKGTLIVLTSSRAISFLANDNIRNMIVVVKNLGLPLIPFLHKVNALIYCYGPKYSSHAAIIAREFNIPVYRIPCEKMKELEKYSGLEAMINGEELVVSADRSDRKTR